MSNSEVFSIYDSKAEAYLRPFYAPNHAVALRWFESACQDPSHDFHRYAADYTLFHIGHFNELTGEHIPNENGVQVNLGNALTFVNMAEGGLETKVDSVNLKAIQE